MKNKNTFITGAFITSFGIIISKILGVIYVIFFHSIVGEEGGALYGYAYTVYNFFMSVASLGIPLSISKMVSEYQALGYYQTKKRLFVLAKRIAILLGFVSFLLTVFLAPVITPIIVGKASVEHIRDVIFVIRISGIALLIVPVLSIYRGYFEGHRLFVPPSVSQVLEQFFRVIVILLGSFLAIKVFHLSISTGVGVALFGATVGGIVAYVYLGYQYFTKRKIFHNKIRKVEEPIIKNEEIIRKVFFYSIPFIAIDFFKSLYHIVDMFQVVRGLVSFQYTLKDAEIIYSILSTWASKFTMIILAISSGVIVSIIPHLTEEILKKKNKEKEETIHDALNVFLFLAIPITFGISFLARGVWTLFYGDSVYGVSVLSFSIFIGLFMGLFTILVIILQLFKDYKGVFISLISGFLFKLLFNSYLLSSFHQMSLPAYYGVIFSSILGYFLSSIICIVYLKKKYSISIQKVLKNVIDILIGSLLMIGLLYLLHFLIPIYSTNRILNLLILALYGIIGGGFYLLISNKIQLFQRVFKKNLFVFFRSIFSKK